MTQNNNFSEFEIIDQSDSESNFENLPPPTGKKHFLKLILALFGILIIVWGGYFLWTNYLSPSARLSRNAEVNYNKYLDWEKKYQQAMEADIYGGKTPQETLSMFKEALKKGDIELASNYFALDENGNRNPKWLEAIKEEKEAGRIPEILKLLDKAKPAGSWNDEVFGFEIRDDKGNLLFDINLIFNKYSKVWKIESM
jgi:uncharacterized protein YeaO (DUF488 family)